VLFDGDFCEVFVLQGPFSFLFLPDRFIMNESSYFEIKIKKFREINQKNQTQSTSGKSLIEIV
jgi:hypothetical protein